MPIAHHRYQPADLVLVRASTYPGMPGTPGMPDPAATVAQLHDWLTAAWSYPGLAEAVTVASPDLADRITGLLEPGVDTSAPTVQRAVSALSSYLARWQRRPTPFGLFAGVGTATVGPAVAQVGNQHRVAARVDAEWLARVLDSLDEDRNLRSRLCVAANNLNVVRGDRIFSACRPQPGQKTPGPIRETSTRHTRAVRTALALAASPIPFADLLTRLAGEFRVEHGKVEALLHGLIDGGFLLTNLRPPMTATDGLTHVLGVLLAAGAGDLPTVAALAAHLNQIHALLTRHNTTNDNTVAAGLRSVAADVARRLVANSSYPLAVDVRLDANVTVAPTVLEEAAHAADLLLRLCTQPFGNQAWVDYHVRFRNRYGPGTLVPVVDLVADSGLGYPHGYLGTPKARPTWRTLTERDVHLARLIQQAMLDGTDEILLSDTDVEALTVGDHTTAVAPARIEVGVTVHAASTAALDRGEFTLGITGAPRTPTSMIGRFAYLLDPADRDRLTRTYTAPAGDGIAVQLSFAPRRVHNENVVRVGRLLPDLVALGEHPDGDVISLDDLAVTADADQMHLVRVSTGQRVIAYLPHALDLSVQTPPLARFLAEICDARSAVFGPFDLGAAARTLPYTPRIRSGRTVLSPARWPISTTDLNPAADADAERWEKTVLQWRQRWRIPARVIVCHGERRLPLDLGQRADRELLRTRLHRAGRLEVREDGPEGGNGWIGRPAEFVIPLMLRGAAPRPLPYTTAPGDTLRPGDSTIVHAQLAGNPGRFDVLLANHLPAFAAGLGDLGVTGWWIRRHRDLARMDAQQHLALLLRLSDPDAFGQVAARLAAFAAGLHQQGLPGDLTLATHYEHPARYGEGDAAEAAEQVFAADTLAAIAQLRMAQQTGIAAAALAAASMAHLAAAFGPDPVTGYQRLLRLVDRRGEPIDRTLSDIARRLADPSDDFLHLRTLAGGDEVATAWTTRDAALRTYHDRLLPHRDPATLLRTLLHEHHVRAVGIDPDVERDTYRLARAAALRGLAAAGAR
jgi:thiopeptide-type bacteriocin biosynthesis protein